MFTDLLEIILSYIQFIVLILNTDPELWPSGFQTATVVASFTNLDDGFFAEYAQIIPQDFRVYFLFVGVLIPLGLILFGLLALNSKKVVLWYTVLLGGLTCLVVGTLGRVLESAGGISVASQAANIMLIVGGCCLFLCIVSFLVIKFLLKKSEEDVSSIKALKEEQTAELQPWELLQQALFFVFLIAAGVVLLVIEVDELSNVFSSFSLALAIVCFIVAFFTMVTFLMGLCLGGRRALWNVSQFFSQNFMRLLLITISILYIPIGGTTMTIFNCNTFSCPDGERLVDSGSLVSVGVNSSAKYCNLCDIPAGQLCPADFQTSLCLSAQENRLESDRSLQCSQMRAFYWPAAGVVAFFFILGTPLMFFALVRRSTNVLRDEFPIRNEDENETVNWMRKVEATDNVAKFLFQSYEYTFRYGRIFQLLHKLFVVVATGYVVRVGGSDPVSVALIAACVIHSVAMILLFVARPFIRKIESVTGAALIVLVVILVILGLSVFYGAAIPSGALSAFLIFCLCAPVLFLVIGLVIEYVAARDSAREKAAEKAGKMEVAAELIATNREHDRVVKKLGELREALAGETTTQKKLEKNTTAAAKDTYKRSMERANTLREEIRGYEDFLDQLKGYRTDLENGEIDMEASKRSDQPPGSPTMQPMEPETARPTTAIQIDSPEASTRPGTRSVALRPGQGRLGTSAGNSQGNKLEASTRSDRLGGSMRPGDNAPRSPLVPTASPRLGGDPMGNSTRSNKPPPSPRLSTFQGGRPPALSTSGMLGASMEASPRGGGGKPPVSPMLGASGRLGTSQGSRLGTSQGGRPPVSPLNPGGARPGTRAGMGASLNPGARPPTQGGGAPGSSRGPTLGSSTRLGGSGRPEPLNSMVDNSDALAGSGRGSFGQGGRPDRQSSLVMQSSGEGSPRFLPRKNSDSQNGTPRANQMAKQLSGSLGSRSGGPSPRGGLTINTGALSGSDSGPVSPAEQPQEDNPNPFAGLGGMDGFGRVAEDEEDFGSSSEEDDFDLGDSDSDDDGAAAARIKTAKKREEAKKAEATKRTDSPTGGLRKTKSVFNEAANAVAALLAAEEEDEEDAQGTIDHKINTDVQATLNRFLMVGGIAGFVALGFAFLGLLTADDQAVQRTGGSTIQSQFLGFSNFTAMAQECCCMPFQIAPPSQVAFVEKWVCTNGAIAERVRGIRLVDNKGEEISSVTGFEIRGFCSTNFTSTSCGPTVSPEGEVEISCPGSTATEEELSFW